MTECTSDSLTFSSAGRREVLADFLGGRLTSDAGILLLKEVDQQIGLLDAINEAIPDPRDPMTTIHDQRTMLAQRIFSLALGYEDLNDQQTMRTDAALQVAAGVAPDEDLPMASPSTLCRLENRVLRQTLERLSKILVEQFIASHDTPPEAITLDFEVRQPVPVHFCEVNVDTDNGVSLLFSTPLCVIATLFDDRFQVTVGDQGGKVTG